MAKLFVIHFQPLELYPPVMNLLRYLSDQSKLEIHVVSTRPHQDKKTFEVKNVFLHRICKWKKRWGKLERIFFYVRFNVKALMLLCKYKPSKVLYFETLSAGAPYFYKRWFNRNSELYIHYHEYTSPEEYQNGMFLNRYLHKLERYIYNQVAWISHTNENRLQLFLRDINNSNSRKSHILPNYPPKSWIKIAAMHSDKAPNEKIGFVYVGALSLNTMYVKEFSYYVQEHSDRCYWDIYSDNHTEDVINWLRELNAPNIFFKNGVEYDDLPGILPAYDIGLILYKGHIPNYIYNAPNKLFEYLTCGLDAWFPQQMEGCKPYVSERWPLVKTVDFSNLKDMPLVSSSSKRYKEYESAKYTCEVGLSDLLSQLNTSSF